MNDDGSNGSISWQALATVDLMWSFYYSVAYAFGYSGPEYPINGD